MGSLGSRQDRDAALSGEEEAGEYSAVHGERQAQGELRAVVEDAERLAGRAGSKAHAEALTGYRVN